MWWRRRGGSRVCLLLLLLMLLMLLLLLLLLLLLFLLPERFRKNDASVHFLHRDGNPSFLHSFPASCCPIQRCSRF